MAQSEKVYERIEEAEEIIRDLVAKKTEELWAVRPNIVAVLGVSNKERPKGCDKVAKISPARGVFKSVLQIYNVDVRYVIEIYFSDWNRWSKAQKIAVIFHELIHIDSEIGKTVKHDIEDFKIMIAALGVNWFNDPELPNILTDDVKFDLALRPNVPEDGRLEANTGDEIIEDA